MVAAFLSWAVSSAGLLTPTVEVDVIPTGAAVEASSEIRASLISEAKQWADRYLAVHKVEARDVKIELHVPFTLAKGVSPREVQFKRAEFLTGKITSNGSERAFSLAFRDGEWTHDARYRKPNTMDTVLRAYVRKAVDKGMGLALSR